MTTPSPFSPPPRSVSLGARLGFFANSSTMFGLGFLAVGLLFAGIVIGATSLSRQFSDGDPRAEGTVLKVVYKGRSSQIFKTPDEYQYAFEVDGHTYHGRSMSNDNIEAKQVTVQYVRSDPELSRIEGMSSPGQSSWWLLIFTLGFGGPGLLVFYAGLQEGRKDIGRLKHGVVVNGAWARQYPNSANQVLYHFTDTDGLARQVAAVRPVSDFVEGEVISLFYVPGLDEDPILFNDLPPKTRHLLLA